MTDPAWLERVACRGLLNPVTLPGRRHARNATRHLTGDMEAGGERNGGERSRYGHTGSQ